MESGPSNPVQLYQQNTHHSQIVWDSSSTTVLSCRRREATTQSTIPFDHRIISYVQEASFLEVAQIGFIQHDWHMITALIERWRPETHTFHLPCGECTITLQDVAVQFGFRVDGQPLTDSLQYDWKNVCEELLGVLLEDLKGSRLSIPWLASQFPELPSDADDYSIHRKTERKKKKEILRDFGKFKVLSIEISHWMALSSENSSFSRRKNRGIRESLVDSGSSRAIRTSKL
ncbi:serine/threonine-protein phosphatase 7 long form homolog [Benincasa hispida]|uniref:serine/threonine-protein phosphatase 7 long form homolog n=1 Tax=Benincasa hispida TaxID=102211 RepID=UPI001901483C|nr:serine/threonine-protein phosphatase 7 long form homolog [Benincasa hispida]